MTYKRILVPVDGSSTSLAGLREAIGLSKGVRAELQLVHVVDHHSVTMMGLETTAYVDDVMKSLEANGRAVLRKAQALAEKGGVKVSAVLLETLAGPAAESIVRQAKKWPADLIVIGTHGRRGLRRVVMGSDAEEVVRTAPVPVLLVRATARR